MSKNAVFIKKSLTYSYTFYIIITVHFNGDAVSVGKKCHSCKYDGIEIGKGKYENIYVKERRR